MSADPAPLPRLLHPELERLLHAPGGGELFLPENYDRLGRVEFSLTQKVCKQLLKLAHVRDRARIRRFLETAETVIESSSFIHHEFYRACDSSGRTILQRWEKQRIRELSPDERQLLECHRTMRPTLLEVLEEIDEQTLLARDLLDPDRPPFHWTDRTCATHLPRFTVSLVWAYDTPCYMRSAGGSIQFDDIGYKTPEEVFHEIVTHLGGPSMEDKKAVQDWLWQNFIKLALAWESLEAARQIRGLEASDHVEATVWYELESRPPDLMKRLALTGNVVIESDPQGPNQEPGGDPYVVFNQPVVTRLRKNVTVTNDLVVGQIILAGRRLKLVASSRKNLARLKTLFESVAGGHARFQSETLVDLAKQMRMQANSPQHPQWVPPGLAAVEEGTDLNLRRITTAGDVEDPALAGMQADFQTLCQEFITQPHPALGDISPQEAAKDPALRARLVGLAKSLVREAGMLQRQKEGEFDTDFMLEALGLEEIRLHSSQGATRLKKSRGKTTGMPGMGPSKVIPQAQASQIFLEVSRLTERQKSQRRDDLWRKWPGVAKFLRAALASGAGAEAGALAEVVAETCIQALRLNGPHTLLADGESMQRRYEAELLALERVVSGNDNRQPERLAQFFQSSPQPWLCLAACQHLFAASADPKSKISPFEGTFLLAPLKAVIAEADSKSPGAEA